MSKKARSNPQLSIPFDSERPPVKDSAETSAEYRLFYVTNASNLRSVLASGLIRPRQGWPKYSPDFQEQTPGYIPLFYGGVPHSQIVDQVTKHDRHDLTVIVEFDATSWIAPNIACARTDSERENADLSKVPLGTQMLLLRGVIPLADVRTVHFASAVAAKRFNSDCQAFSNVRATLLATNDDFSVIPELQTANVFASESIPSEQTDGGTAEQMRRIDAVGGVLAALTRMSQAGGESVIHQVFPEWLSVKRTQVTVEESLSDNLVRTLMRWIRAESNHIDDTMCAVLCCALDFLAAPQAATGFATEALLGTIEQYTQGIREKDQQLLLERLQSIREVVLHDESPAALFQRGGSPVLRGLLLFLLDSEYREERTLPRGCTAGPQDLLLAEIMRGAMNGWSRLPVVMRGDPQSELAVGHAMARLVNCQPGAVSFGTLSFPSADDGAALTAILREVIMILSDKASSQELRQLVIGESAQELDVRVKSKRLKGRSKPVVERDLKKRGKKFTLTFTLFLPWE